MAVLSVWGLIFLAGFLIVFGRDLPDTSKLYDVHRGAKRAAKRATRSTRTGSSMNAGDT